MGKTNHELAKIYENKSKLLGKERLKLRYLENDKVSLENVIDKEYSGKLIIPRFITEVKMGAFNSSNVTEVYIDNSPDINIACTSMFYSSYTDKLIVEFANPEAITSTAFMFAECKKLTSLVLKNFRCKNVRNMTNMFSRCIKLEELDIKSMDTSNTTDMSEMFMLCRSLKYLDISNFNTSKVRNMKSMFSCCSKLDKLDLSNFDTRNVISTAFMFNMCFSLCDINIKRFDASSLKYAEKMFCECNKLETRERLMNELRRAFNDKS